MAIPPRSVADRPANAPSSFPIGVRAPPTMTDPMTTAPPHAPGGTRRTALTHLRRNPVWHSGRMTPDPTAPDDPGLGDPGLGDRALGDPGLGDLVLAIDHVGIAVPDLDAA